MLNIKLNWQSAPSGLSITPLVATMATLCIDGGKKAKMRPGDILGALTGDLGFSGEDIGKINIHPTHAYVAVKQSIANRYGKAFNKVKLKVNQ